MSPEVARAVCQQNDHFRRSLGCSTLVPGRVVMTSGVANLPSDTVATILAQVRSFDDFKLANDPYHEHDLGRIEVPGVGPALWKIDYYASPALEFGSEDPGDLAQTYRLMTIMLAHEY